MRKRIYGHKNRADADICCQDLSNRSRLCHQWFQAADELMLMQLIGYHHCNKLGDPGKRQVRMEGLFILRFAPCKAETVLKVVNVFFHVHADFVGGISFLRAADGSGIRTEVLFRIDIDHSSTGRSSTGIVTVADASGFFGSAVPFPFHLRADKFHSWEPAA